MRYASSSFRRYVLLLLAGFVLCDLAQATEQLELQKVTDKVYAIVGSLGNRNPANLGNNATFGFVVTAAGVVLIDSGGTYQGARQILAQIKRVTSKPVVMVINTGGQDHRWLGNGYFKALGAKIIASNSAVEDQTARKQDQFIVLGNLVGIKGLQGTDAVYADKTFAKDMQFALGGIRFEIHQPGPAHTPGDSFVWLPTQNVMFSGDIVFSERMLGILDYSNSKGWVNAFDAMAVYQPKYIVPGHGHVTTLAKAKADTYDYLVFLRQAVANFRKAGGDISEVSKINQSKFDYLLSYQTLAGRNAQRVYSELEWE
jgi:glyoxylase-like metal-dependent hydrolase (beta-lactamase superfamily II)